MRYSESKQPGSRIDLAESTEERLLRENEELRRQLQQLQAPAHTSPHTTLPSRMWRPSGLAIAVILLGATALIVAAFLTGYVPLQKRRIAIESEARDQEQALPKAEVVQVGRSTRLSKLELPGNIQAITEAPILARADGYIVKRLVDIGDRVRAGQPLAEIEAPELDEQLRQAKANLQQAQASLEQALANYEQGKSNTELAKTTAQRWSSLAARGVVSKQENDQYQSQYQSQIANLRSLEKAILAQRGMIAGAEANVARLDQMQAYRVVKAPFEGVITLRNVDVGALVSAGSTLLYRIAQTGTLRTYVNVPQTNASFIHTGQLATLSVSNLPGRQFTGTVARTANSLDPNSRTLLVEVHVPNGDGALLPGMYAQVDLSNSRAHPPLVVPSVALIVRADGTRVAVVGPDHTVHMQEIEVGRDYGDRLEVLGGLQEGAWIIPNPGDLARDGIKVDPVPAKKAGAL